MNKPTDINEPSPASAGSHNTHMATARLSAANTWLQEEIKRLRLTHLERQVIFRAMYRATGVDSAVLGSLLERTFASAGSVAHPFEQIIRGTVRLHELIEQGRCDSDEADAVRDEMDVPFLELSESEREAARLVSAAIKHRDWIPVAERLPARNVNVLIHIPVADEKTYIASLDEGGMWFSTDPTADAYSLGEDGAPTHWMPLPAPPSDGK